MISATSPAAKYSRIPTEAASAMATRRSALMSCSRMTPLAAPRRIGKPQRTIATHAISTGRTSLKVPIRLSASETAEIRAHTTVTRISFSVQLSNKFLNRFFNMATSVLNIFDAFPWASLGLGQTLGSY